MLCEYGCAQEAQFKFKNGKWCCSDHWSRCPVNKEKFSKIIKARYPKFQKLKKDFKEGKLKCYVCDRPAKYLVYHNSKPCCSKYAKECPGYSGYFSNIRNKYYENNNNYYKGLKRPLHSEALLKENEFGGKGNYGYYHARAHELFEKDECELCGKTNDEQLKEMKKGLTMHCKSENWSDLSESNWTCICHSCHRKIHVKDKETN